MGHGRIIADSNLMYREATQKQIEGVPRHAEDKGCIQGQEEMSVISCDKVCCAGGGRWRFLLVLHMPGLR